MGSPILELGNIVTRLNPPMTPRLRPPASEVQINAAELALGMSFPPDLRQLLLQHNGQHYYSLEDGYGDPLIPQIQTPCFCSQQWVAGLDDIVEITDLLRDDFQYYSNERFRVVGPARYHNKFLSLTKSENADCIVLDLAPEPGGEHGQVVMLCTQPFEVEVLAPNLNSFLIYLTQGYASGKYEAELDEHCVFCFER